ncbi:MAG: mannose-1-phosphate guanylyltransferase [Lentisphaeria bacterium]|nr:mannose-1-phosphate guanylyltransferase [Lentisphaeria bacterium]
MSEFYCVIMAGGKGERFWPCSREERPKQMLNIVGKETLIEQTVLRLTALTPFDHIMIITNAKYAAAIRELLPQLPSENVIGEPCGRDTAPCVALAAGIIRKKTGSEDAVMALMPADHCIHDAAALRRDLDACRQKAEAEPVLTTIGITPDCPSPDYGYIECGEKLENGFYRVRRFVEKPTPEKAKQLLASGTFKWNSGMFVWKVGTVLDIMRQHAPDLAGTAMRLSEAWGTPGFPEVFAAEYDRCRKISIDYAVMEKAGNIVVKEATFDWDDIGNWTSLRNHFEVDANGNVAVGQFESLDSENCIAFSSDPKHLTCAIDASDMIVVHTADVTLVCRRDSAPKIKKFLAQLRGKEHLKGYL